MEIFSVCQKKCGISQKRLFHIFGVARKAYSISKSLGYDEQFSRKMFMLGWLHDVGYEFANNSNHAEESFNLVSLLIDDVSSVKAIKEHGRYPSELTDEYKILNMADMLVDSSGNEVDVINRLIDIKERYGEYSDEYLTSCDVCYRIGLTSVNLAGNHN